MVGVKEKIKPIWVYFGHTRLVYSSFAYYNSFSKKLVIQKILLFMGTFIVQSFILIGVKEKITFLRCNFAMPGHLIEMIYAEIFLAPKWVNLPGL